MVARAAAQPLHVAVHAGRVRPVGLDGDDPEAVRADQLARQARPQGVELRGAMRGLADEDEPRVPDALEERAEVGVREVRDRLRHLAHELGDGGRRGSPPRRFGDGPLGLPALGADERHEAHAAQLLALERCRRRGG